MEELLSVKELTLNINQKEVVDGVSFSIERGERVCLIGESGSGKTLTALSLIGIHPGVVTNGSALFFVKDKSPICLIKGKQKALHSIRGKHIGYVFQEPGLCLNPSSKIGIQIQEVLLHHKKINPLQAKKETIEWIQKVGIENPEVILNRYPHELSGGQKQRIMLIIALAPEPELLIADEPTTALDVVTQKKIIDLILSLCKEKNTALLFITHDQTLAAKVGDKIVLMKEGKLIKTLSSKDFFSESLNIESKTNFKSSIKMSEHRFIGEKGRQKEPILSVQNLSVSYSSDSLFRKKIAFRALDSVSFSLFENEVLGIAGESGSGKTSLAKVLTGIIQPKTGSIHLLGEKMAFDSTETIGFIRKKVRIVFQDPFSSFNPLMRVADQIEEGMTALDMHENSKKRKQKTAEWIERVGLNPDWGSRFPDAFSGGQRQRLAIARALACNPEILICDECVSSLDMSLQRDMLDLLKSLQEENGLSMLFISHDFRTLSYMCNRVLVLQNGKPVEFDHLENILNNPQQEYTQKLIESVK